MTQLTDLPDRLDQCIVILTDRCSWFEAYARLFPANDINNYELLSAATAMDEAKAAVRRVLGRLRPGERCG